MEQLRSFLDYIRLNRNASAHTVAAYDSDLSQFIAFASEQTGKRDALQPLRSCLSNQLPRSLV